MLNVAHGGDTGAWHPDIMRLRSDPANVCPQATLPSGYYQRLAGSTDDVDDTSAMSIEKGTVALAQPFRHHVILQSPKGSEVLARIMYATLQHHASLQYSRYGTRLCLCI